MLKPLSRAVLVGMVLVMAGWSAIAQNTGNTNTNGNGAGGVLGSVRSVVGGFAGSSDDGSRAVCAINCAPPAASGMCGSSNGQLLPAAPSANLCNTGSASGVLGGVNGPWSWTCSGLNGGSNASCTATRAPVPVAGSCGTAHGTVLPSFPSSSQLCSVGTSSTVSTTGGDRLNWTCSGSNGGTAAVCTATLNTTQPPVNGVCGASNNSVVTGTPTALCNVGQPSTLYGSAGSSWNWSCGGLNGGTTSNCGARSGPSQADAVCGSSNGQTLNAKPTSGLCSIGAPLGVSGSGPWVWWCGGVNGGNSAYCAANYAGPSTCTSVPASSTLLCPSGFSGTYTYTYETATCGNLSNGVQSSGSVLSNDSSTTCTAGPSPVNGSCGSSNGQSLGSAPSTGLCSTGSQTGVSGSGPWSWSCTGSNGGSTSSCFANLVSTPVNGSCGSSNGQSLGATPSTGLCSTGSQTGVSGSGPWSWSCTGSNGGSTSSCSASRAIAAVNGVCGTSNGGVFAYSATPSSELCNVGTASPVSAGASYAWSCAGASGGSTASCAATRQAQVTALGDSCVGLDLYTNWSDGTKTLKAANSASCIVGKSITDTVCQGADLYNMWTDGSKTLKEANSMSCQGATLTRTYSANLVTGGYLWAQPYPVDCPGNVNPVTWMQDNTCHYKPMQRVMKSTYRLATPSEKNFMTIARPLNQFRNFQTGSKTYIEVAREVISGCTPTYSIQGIEYDADGREILTSAYEVYSGNCGALGKEAPDDLWDADIYPMEGLMNGWGWYYMGSFNF